MLIKKILMRFYGYVGGLGGSKGRRDVMEWTGLELAQGTPRPSPKQIYLPQKDKGQGIKDKERHLIEDKREGKGK